MNHRDTETTQRRATGLVVTLCALCLCGSTAFGATENWPQLYNTGVTAYKSNDFARAAAMFENATASQDRALQQRALYNLGNADFRLGQAQPQQAQQLWQRALKSYETALALDPNDADAKFNHEYVKKKIEELKKQQEQQKQQQQQNQKDQQNKKQDQKKDEQQQQGQQKQDQEQQQKPEDKQSDQQQQQAQGQQKQEQQKKDEQQKQQAQQEKPSPTEQQPEEKGGQPENSDKMQAVALLDDLRENERNWNFFPEVQMKDLKDSGPPAKDW